MSAGSKRRQAMRESIASRNLIANLARTRERLDQVTDALAHPPADDPSFVVECPSCGEAFLVTQPTEET